MKRTIAINGQNLRTYMPRGVQQVANGVSRELMKRSDIQIIVINKVIFMHNELIAEYSSLEEILSKKQVQNTIDNIANLQFDISDSLLNLGKVLYRKSVKYIGENNKARLLNLRPISRLLRKIKIILKNRKQYSNNIEQKTNYVTIESLDAIISFECFEEIWEWPWELYKCKMYGFVHDLIPFRIHEGPDHNPDLYLKRLSLMALRAEKLFCNSQSTKKDLEEYIPSASHKAITIYLGYEEKDQGEISKKTNLNNKTYTILLVGTIDKRKNYHGFMAGLFLFQTKMRDVKIYVKIAGNNPNRDQFGDINSRAERQDINVQWLGYIDTPSLSRLYKEADVLVYLSLWEGFGIPILEAMAAGIPVLTSSVSSMPEVGGDCVFYADPYDPQDISNKLEVIFSLDSIARFSVINNGTDRVKKFTWKRCVDMILKEIYPHEKV